MHAQASRDDQIFRRNFEAGLVPKEDFTHRAHLRLAYTLLCDHDVPTSTEKMRTALANFLKINGVPAEKYHETLTSSWVQAVRHFMHRAGATRSFDAFLDADDRLLQSDIMLSHYTKATLFSDAARADFVTPDLSPIPQYA